ncbi:hypothetical protein DIJ64_14740 [Mycobacterium leprae]|uniref:Uncharacterized protein MLCB1913.07c n=1 Tax=Mycobacterium leprae TaxID=1769 RepID=O53116_MYCLR|nr:hypothetical protein DIJ64_14740 [Mycobacterium leprae]OAR21089.1 hypothetical protein A8144_07705 [Mycobacterium leprae 3125609]OAX71259.1 hypothetical protein A3216_06920 [Mycobacterium leprae 7935681]CAA17939.1 hypothetical protein MLCB1913.07c [Mycobacterium leprae]
MCLLCSTGLVACLGLQPALYLATILDLFRSGGDRCNRHVRACRRVDAVSESAPRRLEFKALRHVGMLPAAVFRVRLSRDNLVDPLGNARNVVVMVA